MKLTWNDSWILVLLDVGLLGAMPQGVRVVLLHSVVELDLRAEFSNCQSRFFFHLNLDESDDCWTLAAVMQPTVKLAKACNCESQLSTELLQDESGRQAVANFKDFLSVLVDNGQAP